MTTPTMSTPFALGRKVEHDPRSLAHPYAVAAVDPKTVLWDHHAPVLDQGDLSSCTGNALAQWANTGFAQQQPAGPHGYLDEAYAVDLYSRATHLDGFKGVYPPTDSGSSGLGVCKAGVRRGLLTAYKHAFGFTAFLMALQHSPVIVGTSWTRDMFTPDKDGVIHAGGDVAGGHEYLALGADLEVERVTILNSWADTWGRGGRAYISFDDFQQLLAADGDVTVPVI